MTASLHPTFGPSGARGVIITSRAFVNRDPERYHGSGFLNLLIAAETVVAELDDRTLLDIDRTTLAMERLDALRESLDEAGRAQFNAKLLGALCVLAPSDVLEAVQRTTREAL